MTGPSAMGRAAAVFGGAAAVLSMLGLGLGLGLGPAGCKRSPPSGGEEKPTAPAPATEPEMPARSGLSELITFTGACDASGGAGLPGGKLAVADDEDNVLRIYDVDRGGEPVDRFDTRPIFVTPEGKNPEMDLEGMATFGDRIYVIASHGRKKSGKQAPSRLRLFAAQVTQSGSLAIAGEAYSSLIEDLSATPALESYDLARAATLPPNQVGGLNIEGLTDSPAGHLVLGLRNPVPRGLALAISITNPMAVIGQQARAEVGRAFDLDLGGRGIRSLATEDGTYWIVAGSPTGQEKLEPRLYRWSGSGAPVWVEEVRFGDFNPEAVVAVETATHSGLLILSDDGERLMGPEAKRCKKLKDDSRKQFRAAWLLSSL